MKIHQLVEDAYKEAGRALEDHVRIAQMVLGRLLSISGGVAAVVAQSIAIASINGDGYISPYAGQTVAVQGLVTAKGPSGFWLADVDNTTSVGSRGIYVFSTSATVRNQVAVGDIVSLGSARVAIYRATADTDNIFLNELTSPTNITVISSNNTVTPIVIGADRPGPPTEQYTSLDNGNVFGFPNNQSQLSTANPTLQPAAYGLDYWQSLVGTLVTVRSPVALGFPNSYGDFWTHGDWKVTGKNKRGGLTITSDAAGATDANPEAIAIGSPLDGTRNPPAAANSTGLRLGSTLTDITGILTYAFDTYRLLPLTAPRVVSAPDYNPVPTELSANSTADAENCSTLTLGDYNVENLDPKDAHLPVIASHIVQYLKTPDIMWLQEIQDENGATNDGTTSAKGTLDALVAAIRNASIAGGGPGVNYSWAQVDPIDGTNGGEPGGNIRPAFIYKPEVLELINFRQGTANDSAVVSGTGSNATLNFNPALVSPEDSAFVSSRKPLVAHFRVRATNATLWSLNVHQASKGGSSPIEGDWRTPSNGAITGRVAQAKVTSAFIKTILDADPAANVIISGDFNEFLSTPVAFEPYYSVGMRDLDVVVNRDPVERYTYTFDMNNQQLDHALASPAIWNSTRSKVEWEHIHVNTWRETAALRASDHDPSVGKVRLCGTAPQKCEIKIGNWCAASLPSFNNRATCLKLGNSPSDDVYTIKILRGDTFRGYEGFDLVDSYDESPSSKVLVFYVPKIESYGVFKEVVLRHVEMPTEDVRFWVCFNRQNGTIRPFEPVKREMVDSATMAELVSCHGTSVRIKMYLEFADDKKPPLSTHSLVFLKHFDVQRQRIYGVKKIYVHNSSKVSSLNGKINRLMRWRPARKLHLYEEIKPDRIDCLDRNKSFADSEIVNGDIICFQEALSVAETQTLRTQHPRLVLDATQFYAKMRNKSQETKYPKVPKPAIDFVVLPGQSFEDALKSLQERMDILNKDLTGYKFTCSQENDSVVAYSNFDSLMTCTICLELLVDPVSFMDCMHVTCGACAVEWFRHSSTCHQCRQPVRAVHYIHAVAATVEAYCQYNSLANRSDAELANLRAKYKPGQLIEINRREKIDSDPTAEERPMSTAGCPGCNPGNELHFLCPEPILDDAGNTMFPGHARCEDCNAHLPLMPEFSLECCAVCTRFTCRELKLQCGSASTTAPFLIQPLGTIRFPKELDTNLFETIPIKYEREVLIKYAQDYDMGAQELFTVLLELHEGAGLPRASWHGVGRAPFDRDFVSSNNLVCVTCAKDLVAGALLTWGQSIGPSLSPARRLCEFGIACRQALVDEGHAQTFSHICTPTGNNHPRRLRDDTGAQEDGNRVVCDHTELGDQGRYSFSFDTEEIEFKRDGSASFLCSVVVHSELQEHGQTSTYPGSTVIKQGEAIAVYLEGNRERAHSGPIRLLLDRRNMRWVRTSRGQIPPGCRPILGGVDRSNSWETQELYHCAAWLGGVRVPGYISRTMKHAHVAHPFDGELWKVSDDYELLCWA